MGLLKYPGGKEKELPVILRYMPETIDSYYEPFVGGGSVYLAVTANHYSINDKSEELMDLYRSIRVQDNVFFEALGIINHNWNIITEIAYENAQELLDLYHNYDWQQNSKRDLNDHVMEFILSHALQFNGMFHRNRNYCIDRFLEELAKSLLNKIIRMKKLEVDKGVLSDDDVTKNIEGALKAAYYCHCRFLYNHRIDLQIPAGFSVALYLFIRDMCYSSMFRYNAKGEFNVPYGGISYNGKSLRTKIDLYQTVDLINRLEETDICSLDFEEYLTMEDPQRDDFVFVDPPYDTEFSSYAGMSFDRVDQERLANWLINDCRARFMVVIKKTDYIDRLYPEDEICQNGNRLRKLCFDKKYMVSFMDRNDKNAQHLLIMNY